MVDTLYYFTFTCFAADQADQNTRNTRGRFSVFWLRYSLPHNTKADPCDLASECITLSTENRPRVFFSLDGIHWHAVTVESIRTAVQIARPTDRAIFYTSR